MEDFWVCYKKCSTVRTGECANSWWIIFALQISKLVTSAINFYLGHGEWMRLGVCVCVFIRSPIRRSNDFEWFWKPGFYAHWNTRCEFLRLILIAFLVDCETCSFFVSFDLWKFPIRWDSAPSAWENKKTGE